MSNNQCLLCGAKDISATFNGAFKLFRCRGCEFQWIDDHKKHLSDDWFKNYYSRRKENPETQLNEKREKQYEIDAAIVNEYLKDGDKVLDVGCSYGKFLHVIASLGKKTKCTGIDIDEFAISEAKVKFGDAVEFEAKSLLSVDASNGFDLVIFRGTLQYLGTDLSPSLRHLHHILKNDGRVVIFSLPSTDAFMYELLREEWALFHPEMQLMFNEYSIRVMAEKYGFLIEDLQYPYLEDVYSNPEEDYANIKDIILGKSQKSNPFWGSIMRIILTKDVLRQN